ncbi:Holliday junction branch migration protein RuvA [Arenimonas sp.]|nr:Holliday junction branch migration protein RuvA [Candidatus Parcubacteria bacterium]
MISYLEGRVKYINQKNICVLTSSGVGYEVQIDKNQIDHLTIDQDIQLHIYTNVKEDALDLYGFLERSEKIMFEQLTSISGIGPKSALQILTLSGAQVLYENVVKNNVTYLTQISGIGKKIAEKIVLELRDKLPKIAFEFGDISHENNNINLSENMDVFEALKSMGYTPKEAKDAITGITDNTMTLEQKIKFALKNVHN